MRLARLLVAAAPVALAAALFTPMAASAQSASAIVTAAAMPATKAAPQVRRAVSFSARPGAQTGTLVLPLTAEGDLTARTAGLSSADRDAISRALTSANFSYGARSTLSLRGIGSWGRILVVGLGKDPVAATVQSAGIVAGRTLMSEPGPVTVMAQGLDGAAVAELATGMGIGEYRSDFHKSKPRDTSTMGATTIVTGDAQAAQSAYTTRGVALVDAMAWTRDISNEPANIVYPETFVERARAAFAGIPGVTIEVLDVPAMQQLGMGSILGSGGGSARPPRMLAVRYKGQGAPAGGPLVMAGKGITFDSGGISLKPGAGMGNMKHDMSGAASVTGAVLALAKAGAPVDVVAVSALSENMPGGRALRPADVVTAMNGKTIEIISTDAEGRLVLADAMVWSERTFNPSAIVDVATLTGAVGGALGDDYAGLFSRHDELAAQLKASGKAVGEELWQLPLHPSYGSDTSSTIADIKNGGGSGAGAGTGAWFIGEFVSRDIPWAHLDIANMAYGGPNDQKPDGSAAFSLRLLENFARNYKPLPRGEGKGGY